MSASSQHFKISSINSSRSAFGVFDFDPDFFSRYDLLSAPGENPHVSFCVTAKVRRQHRAREGSTAADLGVC